MNLIMRIKNVKAIKDLEFTFPLEQGLYAITGENASGKSTLVACASSVFFNMPMYNYFGRPTGDASIEFTLGEATRQWTYTNDKWVRTNSKEKMKLNGFYEGSIIFGNRFKDTIASNIPELDKLTIDDLTPADDFVRLHLGEILHDDSNFYKNLYYVEDEVSKANGFSNQPYFYATEQGQLISQARMSTGENLLISILHSLNIVREKRIRNVEGRPCIVFLDEIELALHASALRRLVNFLEIISGEFNLSIFFSTHSIELIRHIKPQNIYYLNRVNDNIFVTNPCYPAFATRNLYSEDGYGNDMVILVEDDVSKAIVEKVLLRYKLINNIRIKVLPTGGWTNTIIMAYDLKTSRLLTNGTKIVLILDRDIKGEVPKFLGNNPKYQNVSLDYLPISSLEKYLKKYLIDNMDKDLFNFLDSYLFQRTPLTSIIQKYKANLAAARIKDTDGKSFYGLLIDELRGIRKDRDDLADMVVQYLMDNNQKLIDQLANFLKSKIEP